MHLADLRLSTKLLAGYGILIVLFLLVSGLVYLTVVQLVADSRWVAHTHEVMAHGERLSRLLVDRETGERGFLMTGREEFLEPYLYARREIPRVLAETRALVRDDRGQLDRLAEIEALADRWDRDAGRPEIATRRAVNAGRSPAHQAAALLEASAGKRLMDELRGRLEAFTAAERQLLAARFRAAATSARLTIVTVFGAAGLAALVALAVAIGLTRHVTRRLGQMAGVARSLAAGDLGQGVAVVGDDEVGRLSAAFEQMLAYFRGLAGIAERIVARDFAVTIEPRGERDQLGQALARMVHELTSANEQLAESEARFRGVADTAPVLIWISGADRRRAYVNTRWLSFTGRTLAETLGDGWAESVHPEDRPQCRETYHAAFEARRPFETEYRLRRADGEYRWVLDVGVPRFTREGGFEGYIGSALDVTDRKRAEAGARQLAAIVESSDDAIIAVTLDGVIESWNAGAERTYGYAADEVRGRSLALIVPPDRCDELSRSLERVRRGERIEPYETVRTRKDGTSIDVAIRMSPVTDDAGRIVRASGIARDITDRKRGEAERERLLRREQAVRAAAEAAAVDLRDVNEQLLLAGTRERALTGQAEAAERQARFLAAAGARLAASLDFEATLREVVRLTVPVLADWCVISLLEPDGTMRAVEIAHADPAKAELAESWKARTFPVRRDARHGSSKAIATGQSELRPEVTDDLLVAVAHDEEHLARLRAMGIVSALWVPLTVRDRVLGALVLFSAESRRRYGDADLAVAEELARRAAIAIDHARLFRDAQQAIREALEATRARDAFLARASHELRTPLTSILGTMRLLRRALAGTLAEPPDGLLAIAERNLITMATLVHNLLDASKLTAGPESLMLDRVDAGEIVSASLDVVAPQAREKGVTLRVSLPPGLALRADRLRLEQLLVNLLANAVKFTPAGGEVEVDAGLGAAEAEIRVRDTGEGIAREYLERIFEPFFQAEQPSAERSGDRRARRARGTGLGLAICRQIAALHGGRIWAESEGPGRGSTFTVRLPLDPARGKAA